MEGMNADMESARIPGHKAGEGTRDVHALQTLCINTVVESGASLRKARSLARRSTPDLTTDVYGRTRRDLPADLAEAVGRRVLGEPSPIGAPLKAVGNARPCGDVGCKVTLSGFEPELPG